MENSRISWCTHTFNAWLGCIEVSDGCRNCYARKLVENRMGKDAWGPKQTTPRIRTSSGYWKQPLKWNRDAIETGERPRVFCGSLMDAFEDHPDAESARPDLFKLIENTRQVIWMLLTKRSENISEMVPDRWLQSWPENVWPGVSAEDQKTFNERSRQLLRVPAGVRWISAEPLLATIDMRVYLKDVHKNGINWVIAGGESGPGHRPMQLDWVRSIRDQCVARSVPFHYKQYGGVHPGGQAVLDGREWREFPETVGVKS